MSDVDELFLEGEDDQEPALRTLLKEGEQLRIAEPGRIWVGTIDIVTVSNGQVFVALNNCFIRNGSGDYSAIPDAEIKFASVSATVNPPTKGCGHITVQEFEEQPKQLYAIARGSDKWRPKP